MVKIYRYEFDPCLFLYKLKPSSVFIPPVRIGHLHRTDRFSRSLRMENGLNHKITTPDLVRAPMSLTYDNFITNYDSRKVYQEERNGS